MDGRVAGTAIAFAFYLEPTQAREAALPGGRSRASWRRASAKASVRRPRQRLGKSEAKAPTTPPMALPATRYAKLRDRLRGPRPPDMLRGTAPAP